MSQEKSTQATSRQAEEAAGALQFISRVMARTREQMGDYAAIGIWWGTLTVLGVLATCVLGFSGHSTVSLVSLVWAVHNVIGWSATLVIIRRSGATTPSVRRYCAMWAATTLAIWVVVAASLWAGAVAPWALWTMLQLVIGLTVVTGAIMNGSRLGAGVGLVLMGSVPVILTFPDAAFLITAALIAGVYAFSGFLAWRQRRRTRGAS